MTSYRKHFSSCEPEYYSCPWIEAGLAFGPESINCCCISHHGDRGWPLLVPNFSGDVFPLKEVLTAKHKLLITNQNPGHDTACRGCHFLQKRRWQPQPYLFNRLNFSHFSMCNLRCVYCWTMQPDAKGLDAKIINLVPSLTMLINKKLLAPRSMIFWGGGEPTILPEFEKIFSLLAKHGVFQTLNTNALVLSPAILQWLPQSRFKIVISIDAGTPETYKEIKGVNAFVRVWEHAEKYAAAGRHRVFAKYILMESNYGEVIHFLNRVDKAGIKLVFADVDERSTAIPAEIIEAAGLMSYELRRRGIWFGTMGVGANALPEQMWSHKVAQAHRRLAQDKGNSMSLIELMGFGRQMYHSAAAFLKCGYDPAAIRQNLIQILSNIFK